MTHVPTIRAMTSPKARALTIDAMLREYLDAGGDAELCRAYRSEREYRGRRGAL